MNDITRGSSQSLTSTILTEIGGFVFLVSWECLEGGQWNVRLTTGKWLNPVEYIQIKELCHIFIQPVNKDKLKDRGHQRS